MTLIDILREYEPTIEIKYGTNLYSDMRKKLLSAFECVGLYDMSIFKSENGKDYDFLEENKEYVFYLLRNETSPLFKKIKGNKMAIEDYIALAEEVEKLFEFIKPYTKNEEEYNKIVADISSNVRYPILRQAASMQNIYYNFNIYYESLIKGDDELAEIDYFGGLTPEDKVMLFDELMTATKRWVQLAHRLKEYREDEVNDAIDNVDLEKVKTYCMVENVISEQVYNATQGILEKAPSTKSRSLRAEVEKEKNLEAEVCKIRYDIAKKHCDKHNIDFDKYLAEKGWLDNNWPDPSSSKVAFEEILDEI